MSTHEHHERMSVSLSFKCSILIIRFLPYCQQN